MEWKITITLKENPLGVSLNANSVYFHRPRYKHVKLNLHIVV